MLQRTASLNQFLLERFLRLLPNPAPGVIMSSPEAIQKIEQAKALIEEARAAVQGKSDLDAVSKASPRMQLLDC